MNKYLLSTIIALVGCQTATNQKQESGAIPGNSPERRVSKNILISTELPQIEIKVDDEFDYIGSFDFEIIASSDEYSKDIAGKPIAGGDRFVFVSKDNAGSVEKLFIVQLEGFLPTADFTYNYNFSNAEFIGQNRYRQNTWFYNSEELAKENPTGEGALTRKFLFEKGFHLESEYMMSRFVGLASEDRRNEIIIYYIEMLGQTTGYSLDEYENVISEREAQSIRNSLIDRSKKSFEIIKG